MYSATLNPAAKKNVVLNKFALLVLLFFGVFDTARSFTVIPAYFGYLKEIAIFFLFFQLLFLHFSIPRKKKILLPGIICIGIFSFNIIRCFAQNIFYLESLIYQIKNMEFYLLFIIFFNLKKIVPSWNVDSFFRRYLFWAMALIFVNVVGCSIPNPICYKMIGRGVYRGTMYAGRFSLGQPAMATFPILLAFLHFITRKKLTYAAFGGAILCLTSIFISTALTAYVIIAAMIVCVLFISLKQKIFWRKNLLRIIIGLLIILVVMSLFGERISIRSDFLDLGLLERRVNSMVGVAGVSDASMNIRSEYQKIILKSISTPFKLLWGLGPNYYINLHFLTIPIENTYYDILAKCGVLGVFAHLIFLTSFCIDFLQDFFRSKDFSRFLIGLGIFLVFLLYGWTIPIFGTFTMAFGLALYMAIWYNKGDENV